MNTAVVTLTLFAVTLTGANAAAQQLAEPPAALPFIELQAAPVPAPPFEAAAAIDVLGVEPFELTAPVEDAPYSAEVVTEMTQVLGDGNRIERRSTGTVARDSRGRVRREQPLTAIGPFVPQEDIRLVTVSDPATGVTYHFDDVRKVAMRSKAPTGMVMRAPAMAVADRAQPGPPAPHTELLGTRVIEGILAEGTRTTLTLPAGVIGNQFPIEVVSERWFSPELRVVVYSRRTDPRLGETIYRLMGIRREEPPADLFRVPAGYRVEELEPFAHVMPMP